MAESSRGTQLTLNRVRRSFGTRQALLPISFKIEAGEFVSLLGPSGSGKSTLLRILAGLETIDSGELDVSSSGVRSGGRSFVFQDPALLPWRTVLANVMLPLELTAPPHAQHSAALEAPMNAALEAPMNAALEAPMNAALEALDRVGLKDVVDLYPNQLSGGMKMRVSVARAIVSRPSLLLLDEPFAALDERTRHRLQEDLRGLWKSLGMTVVFVTHSASEAVFVSNRTLVLSGGPGRVLADRKIDLGDVRTSSLRSEARYYAEIDRVNKDFELDGGFR